MRQSNIVWVLSAALAAAGPASSTPGGVPYPEGYRGWTHVTSAIGHPPPGNPKLRFDGMHHIYANGAALDGYRTGRFADGAVIVFDRFAVEESKVAITPTARLSLDVMVRDSRRFAKSGGWGFERFAGEDMRTRVIDEAEREQCASCHRRVEARGMVFSRLKDPPAASAKGR